MNSRSISLLASSFILLALSACSLVSEAVEPWPSVQLAPAVSDVSRDQVRQAKNVMEQRLETGVDARVRVRASGSTLTIQVQNEDDLPAVRELASRQGVVVVFASAEYLPPGSYPPAGAEVVLTDFDIAAAETAYYAPTGRYETVSFRLTSAGSQKLAAHTRAAVGEYLGFSIDGQVITCPAIQTPILDGRGTVVGDFDEAGARRLAAILNGGRLPYPLQLVEP
jgi:preprotein translocase subunit SecD